MDEARGIATCGGGQLVTGMGDLPEQVHGFGVGGSSRREWYGAETIAYGSHSFASRLQSVAVRITAVARRAPTVPV